MQTKIKIHDGIVGTVVLAGALLGLLVDLHWLYVPAVIGGLMISSAFTGFCPVYFVLNKMLPQSEVAPK